MRIEEPLVVADVFAAKLGRVDVLSGGFARLVFIVDRTNGVYRIATKVVIPVSAAPDVILALSKATAIEMIGTGEIVYN
jgi:hypothetical protein